jgi:crotonobetainyl-CoA:carnitine CoA-transferase CaiB-like acyl-CoA transferase
MPIREDKGTKVGRSKGAADMPMKRPLKGLKVLDLTHYIAGPYCTKLLADYGAEVIKIEKPGSGDGSRKLGPFPGDRPHPEKSGLFLHLNTNKKGITLNLKTADGIKIFKALIQWADVLVENFAPRVMPKLGFDYKNLSRIHPGLVVTSISNFGQTGPYRDYRATELVLYGMGGAMISTGMPDQPLKLAGSVKQYQAGTVASAATMGAVFGSRLNGIGQHVDISIMEVQSASADRRATSTLCWAYSGGSVFFRSERLGLLLLPHGRYPCMDGFVEFAGAQPVFWPRWVKMLNMPELMDDPRFKDLGDMTRKDEFDAIFLPWMVERTKQEIMEKAQKEGLPAAALLTPKDVVEDRHLKERNFFVEISHPEAGTFKYPGAPFKMGKTPWAACSPAPCLGQHNESVYGDLLGYDKKDLVRLRNTGVI